MFDFPRRPQAILHLTWTAFFLTFVAWFNMAPFNTSIMKTMGLSDAQMKLLMVANVALTIPARILIGSLVDRHGPRKVYIWILLYASVVCLQCALARTFGQLFAGRLLMGVAGAGFVVGIKMIGEWFPQEKMGLAQGIYGGWGCFGAAAAAFALPPLASILPEDTGWRAAILLSGLLCLVWAGVYARFAEDSPQGHRKFQVALDSRLEVSSHGDLALLAISQIPVYGALALLVWKLAGHPLPLLSPSSAILVCAVLATAFVFHVGRNIRFNLPRLREGIPGHNRYLFGNILILALMYSLTFGSEVAVVSMFPQYLETLFHLDVTQAGILGSSFAFMNLVTRPGGGWFSDRIGRRRSLAILVAGASVGFCIMSRIDSAWPVAGAVASAILCSIFLQAGNGACFALVPMIRRDLTGKMAGLAGAYGNVGSVVFLIVFSFVDAPVFFALLAGYSLFILSALAFLKLPEAFPQRR